MIEGRIAPNHPPYLIPLFCGWQDRVGRGTLHLRAPAIKHAGLDIRSRAFWRDKMRRCGSALAVVLASSAACVAQTDTFHLMQIELALGGLGGDPTRQAVQLRMRAPFNNFMNEGRLIAWDKNGQNPVMLTDFPNKVPNFDLGARVLIVSPGFPLPAGMTTDFTMDAIIPSSYLLAGRLTFEDDFGTILWSLAWGGANYTGSNLGSLTNDLDGDFGPPFPGPLTLISNRAVLFQGPPEAPSTTNLADYALTPGAGTLTNNAGQSGVLNPACYPDCNGSSTLTIADFGCFQSRFAQGHPGADCNASGTLTIADFGCFQSTFSGGCP